MPIKEIGIYTEIDGEDKYVNLPQYPTKADKVLSLILMFATGTCYIKRSNGPILLDQNSPIDVADTFHQTFPEIIRRVWNQT